MASSIEAMSTEDMGFRPEMRRLDEMDMRLLDIDEWEERAEAIEDDGELERGVEKSEPDGVYEEYDAIGTIACEDGGAEEREEEEDEGRRKEMNSRSGAGSRGRGVDGSCKPGIDSTAGR